MPNTIRDSTGFARHREHFPSQRDAFCAVARKGNDDTATADHRHAEPRRSGQSCRRAAVRSRAEYGRRYRLWVIRAADCYLVDGLVYHYWFEVTDVHPARTGQRIRLTDPMAFMVDWRLVASRPTDAFLGWLRGERNRRASNPSDLRV